MSATVPAEDAPAALEVRGLRASYSGQVALHDVAMSVAPGSLTAVLGPSGCGKTTLLRVVAGFHAPDAGEVRLAGRPVAGRDVDVPPERRGVGVVPQDGALFEHLTVAGNVAYGLTGRRRSATSRERVRAMLDLVGLADLADRRPRELSGGQQQRVALARALAPGPELVLLDEPFSALDAGLRREVREQVRSVLRTAGAAAVIVTHDRGEALALADRLLVLSRGRVVADGSPRGVYDDPADAEVAALVGDVALLPARRRGRWATTALGEVALRGAGVGNATEDGLVVVRPEQLTLGTGCELVVREVLFHGPGSTLVVDLPDGSPLRVAVGRTVLPRPGDAVVVGIAEAVTWLPGSTASTSRSPSGP